MMTISISLDQCNVKKITITIKITTTNTTTTIYCQTATAGKAVKTWSLQTKLADTGSKACNELTSVCFPRDFMNI